jgi:uncharacterized protein
MLEMRPDCERCGRDLPPAAGDAFICSFECTFCTQCAQGPLGGACPNCGGMLERRPTRAEHLLARHPASTVRKGPA